MENLYDIHCHAVPGVDDGARSIEEALEILRAQFRDGVRTVILTPHYRKMMFETPREKVKENFELLKAAAQRELPAMRLFLGCEFHTNMDMIQMLQSDESYRMAGSRYVLLEFSGANPVDYILDRVYQAVAGGFEPIVAHVERYAVLWKNMSAVERMIRMGARLQVNAESILGRSDRREKKFCQQLIKNDWLSFIGSDAHDTMSRPPLTGECARYVEKKFGKDYAERIFIRNPEDIVI